MSGGGVTAIFMPDAYNDMKICHIPAGRLVANATVCDMLCQLPCYEELMPVGLGHVEPRNNLTRFHENCHVFGVVGECVDDNSRKTYAEIGYASWEVVLVQDVLILWRDVDVDVDVPVRLLVTCEVRNGGMGVGHARVEGLGLDALLFRLGDV